MIAYRMFINRELVLDTLEGINDGILSANFKLEINKTSTFEFSMVMSHPLINEIKIMRTAVIVEMLYVDSNNEIKDDYYPFVGRVVSIDQDMYGNRSFNCEGGSTFEKDQIFYQRFEFIDSHLMHISDVFLECRNATYNQQNFVTEAELSYHITLDNDNNGSNIPWELIEISNRYNGNYDEDDESTSDSSKFECSLELLSDAYQNYIIGPYGGVIYYYYTNPEYDETTKTYPTSSINRVCINCAYYASLTLGFDYNNSINESPSEPSNGLIEVIYGSTIPSFGLNDNIMDIKPNNIKTGIWTGILPIGKDLMTLSYKDNRVTEDSVIWNYDLVEKYGKIPKMVNFSQIDNRETLRALAENYLRRFTHNDYFSAQTYEISGIEPCEVFEDTNNLIKLGFPVVIQVSQDDLIAFPCLSIEQNLFDIQQSRYVIGPYVPDMIINEDFSSVYR